MGTLRVLSLVAGAALCGCVSALDVEIDGVGFNERIRLDRNALGPEQIVQDPAFGTFRTGDSDVVAELYPVTTAASYAADNLPRGDCLWVAQDSTRSQGDVVALSWEAIVLWDAENSDGTHRIPPEDRDLSMCRFDDPVSRQPPRQGEFEEDGTPVIGGTTHEVPWTASVAFPLAIPDESGERWADHDYHFPLGRLREFTTLASNPTGECRVEAFADDPRTPTVWNCPVEEGLFDRGVPETNVSVCGIRCATQPTRDTTYEVGVLDRGRFLKPQVMVVDRTRTIARPMTAVGTTFRWDTPVSQGPNAESGTRWGETFTPTVRVKAVRFYRDVAGVKAYLPSLDGPLCVRQRPDDTDCYWTCDGAPDGDGRWTVDLEGQAPCRNPQGGTDNPRLTPVYDADLLTGQEGQAVPGPLRWSATVAPAPSEPVFVELELKSLLMGAALRAEPPVLDYGDVQDGGTARGWSRVENVGHQAVKVESIEVVPYYPPGPTVHPEDFERWVTGTAVPVPLPVDVEPTPKDTLAGTYTMSRGTDFSLWPLLDVSEPEGAVVVRPSRLDGVEASVYGEPVRFEAGVGFVPAAVDFRALAAQWSGKWRPLHRLVLVEQTLPYNLKPGESLRVLVTARPRGLGGRDAGLRVRASVVGDPSHVLETTQPLRVRALSGPTLSVVPHSMWFPRGDATSTPGLRRVLLANDGQTDLTRGVIGITGTDAALFEVAGNPPGSLVIAPGQSEVLTVVYRPRSCSDPAPPPGTTHRATLEVASNGGSDAVELYGDGAWCEP